jgi:hypothetical protein
MWFKWTIMIANWYNLGINNCSEKKEHGSITVKQTLKYTNCNPNITFVSCRYFHWLVYFWTNRWQVKNNRGSNFKNMSWMKYNNSNNNKPNNQNFRAQILRLIKIIAHQKWDCYFLKEREREKDCWTGFLHELELLFPQIMLCVLTGHVRLGYVPVVYNLTLFLSP